MTDCEYCGAQFDTDEEYVAHLHEAHTTAELGRIDTRRVEHAYGEDSDSSSDWSGPILIAGLILFASGLLGVVVALPGPAGGGMCGHGDGHGDGSGPSNLGAVHYHGTMQMTVNRTAVDFSADRYQLKDQAFHFEGGRGTRWHVHARDVTLRYALSTLGIEATRSSVQFDGSVYRDTDPDTSVAIRVNGNPVTPSEYVLRRGDHVRIVIETNANGSH